MRVPAVIVALVAVAVASHRPRPFGAGRAVARRAASSRRSRRKSENLRPAEPGKAEAVRRRGCRTCSSSGNMHWHPFWQNAYSGGGFTLGAGYCRPRELLQPARRSRQHHALGLQAARGGVLRAGAVRAPRHAVGARRLARGDAGRLLRHRQTSTHGRTESNYGFTQPYLGATLEVFPARNACSCVRGGVEVSQWKQGAGAGNVASVETVYTPGDAARPRRRSRSTSTRRARSASTARPARGYARRGGFYGVTFHDFTDTDDAFGFNQIDYEAIQHIPILREAWVLSLRALRARRPTTRAASRCRSS